MLSFSPTAVSVVSILPISSPVPGLIRLASNMATVMAIAVVNR